MATQDPTVIKWKAPANTLKVLVYKAGEIALAMDSQELQTFPILNLGTTHWHSYNFRPAYERCQV